MFDLYMPKQRAINNGDESDEYAVMDGNIGLLSSREWGDVFDEITMKIPKTCGGGGIVQCSSIEV